MLTDNTSLTPRFTTPHNEASAIFSFALKVTDNEGESVQSDVDIDVRPIITGLVVDDVLSNATVQLLNVADQSLILETQTDENGRYVLAQQQSLPPRYVLSITGGTLNGEPFVGTLNSICLTTERLSCHATPLSTLIKRYADQQGTLETGDKTLWVETLSAELGFDLTSEPFINEDETIVPLSTIREFLQNGAQLEQWLTTILDYVENDTPNEDVESWFPTANLAPTVSAGDDQTVNEQSSVTLSATASDADGTIASYLWSQTSGANVNLIDAASATTSFSSPTATRVATLIFSVTATDNDGDTTSDSITVTVNPVNTLPLINAGVDQSDDEQ
ncbi:MAG: hypothetical protein MJK04_29090, partial [Psychrosphaera sp.]|nr:hypothetical protein [Psychrosphaera sp.]